MNSKQKIGCSLILLAQLVIIVLSIIGLIQAQLLQSVHFFIVILVLTIFVTLVILFVFKSSSKSNDYDVNKKAKGGKDNAAFAAEEGRNVKPTTAKSSASGASEKWVANYVPHGDYPAGSASASASAAPQEAAQNGEAKWQKNYVPYKAADE